MAVVRALGPVKSIVIGIGRSLDPGGPARRARRRPDVTVVSPGGVATTTLMKQLERFVSINSPKDLDGLKHLPVVPTPEQGFPKVLFIYGDGEAIYRSLKGRGLLGRQGAKLGCALCPVTTGPVRRRLFIRAVERQIGTFRAAEGPNLMALSYEQIWDRLPEIAAFCGIRDDAFIRKFPPRRPRTSG